MSIFVGMLSIRKLLLFFAFTIFAGSSHARETIPVNGRLANLARALATARELRDWELIAKAYLDIASYHESHRQYSNAMLNLRKGGLVFLQHKDFNRFADYMYKASVVRQKQHMYEAAFRLCDEALIYYQYHGPDLGRIEYGIHLEAKLYWQMGQYEYAACLLKEVITSRLEGHNMAGAARAYYELANLYAEKRICGADHYVAKAAEIFRDPAMSDIDALYRMAPAKARKTQQNAERRRIGRLYSEAHRETRSNDFRTGIIWQGIFLAIVFAATLLFKFRTVPRPHKSDIEAFERLGENILSRQDIRRNFTAVTAAARAASMRLKALALKHHVAE